MEKKEICKKITKKSLDEFLGKIGWTTKWAGANYYFIANQYSKNTNWRFHSKDENMPLEELSYEGEFGDGHKYSNGGSCVFLLKKCFLYFSENNTVGICGKGKNYPSFIQFYNFKTR